MADQIRKNETERPNFSIGVDEKNKAILRKEQRDKN